MKVGNRAPRRGRRSLSGLPSERVRQIQNLQLTWGLKKIFCRPTAPSLEIDHLLRQTYRYKCGRMASFKDDNSGLATMVTFVCKLQPRAGQFLMTPGRGGTRFLPTAARHVVPRAARSEKQLAAFISNIFIGFSAEFDW